MAAVRGAAWLGPGCSTILGDVVIEVGVEAFGSCEELFAKQALKTGVRGRHNCQGKRGQRGEGGGGGE